MTTKAATPSEEDELAILFPDPVTVKIGTDERHISIDILPMNLETCLKFSKASRPIVRHFTQSLIARGELPSLEEDFIERCGPDFLLAIVEFPREAIESIALATGKSPAFIAKLPQNVPLQLLPVIFAVNADFFAQSVGSLASGAWTMDSAKTTPTTQAAGQTH